MERQPDAGDEANALPVVRNQGQSPPAVGHREIGQVTLTRRAGVLRTAGLDIVGPLLVFQVCRRAGISEVWSLVIDDPQAVLLEGAAITAAFGVACLVSLTRRRPLIFYFAQAFYGGPRTVEGAELDADYDRYQEARGYWRTGTTVWGLVDLAEAVGLAIVALTASTSTALLVNRTVPWLVTAGLFAWMFRWGERLRAQKPDEADADAQHPSARAD